MVWNRLCHAFLYSNYTKIWYWVLNAIVFLSSILSKVLVIFGRSTCYIRNDRTCFYHVFLSKHMCFSFYSFIFPKTHYSVKNVRFLKNFVILLPLSISSFTASNMQLSCTLEEILSSLFFFISKLEGTIFKAFMNSSWITFAFTISSEITV